jgi:glucose 1-dehydrogenase
MKIDMKDKVVLVTGAARGIGKAITKKYLEEGASVIIADVLVDEAKKTVEEFKNVFKENKIIFHETDISQKNEVETLFTVIKEEFGKLDILVNNAGILVKSSFFDTTEEMWDKTMSVNLKGTFLCSKEAAEIMKNNDGGNIVNISSIDGEVVYYHGHHVPYGVSKAGIIMLTKIMAAELADYNIRVNAVAPGVVKTDISGGSMKDSGHFNEVMREIPLKKLAVPEEVAGAVVFLTSSEASYITGTTLFVDGGWTIH